MKISLFAKLTFFLLSACAAEVSMSNEVIAKHEELSSDLLARPFSGIEELKDYLEKSGTKYTLKEDLIGGEPPQAAGISWHPKEKLYYLVLLPRGPNKIYRFRIYPTKSGLHLEGDFSYKNPYQ